MHITNLFLAQAYLRIFLIFFGSLTDCTAHPLSISLFGANQKEAVRNPSPNNRRFAITGNSKITRVETKNGTVLISPSSGKKESNAKSVVKVVFSPLFSIGLTALYVGVLMVVICCCRIIATIHHWFCDTVEQQDYSIEDHDATM